MLLSRGAWRYAGMSAVVTGLDFVAALARLPEDPDLDTHAVRELLLTGEAAGLKTLAEMQDKQTGES